jgi:hypothetical protein
MIRLFTSPWSDRADLWLAPSRGHVMTVDDVRIDPLGDAAATFFHSGRRSSSRAAKGCTPRADLAGR